GDEVSRRAASEKRSLPRTKQGIQATGGVNRQRTGWSLATQPENCKAARPSMCYCATVEFAASVTAPRNWLADDKERPSALFADIAAGDRRATALLAGRGCDRRTLRGLFAGGLVRGAAGQGCNDGRPAVGRTGDAYLDGGFDHDGHLGGWRLPAGNRRGNADQPVAGHSRRLVFWAELDLRRFIL